MLTADLEHRGLAILCQSSTIGTWISTITDSVNSNSDSTMIVIRRGSALPQPGHPSRSYILSLARGKSRSKKHCNSDFIEIKIRISNGRVFCTSNSSSIGTSTFLPPFQTLFPISLLSLTSVQRQVCSLLPQPSGFIVAPSSLVVAQPSLFIPPRGFIVAPLAFFPGSAASPASVAPPISPQATRSGSKRVRSPSPHQSRVEPSVSRTSRPVTRPLAPGCRSPRHSSDHPRASSPTSSD